jgi:hypothetical protein
MYRISIDSLASAGASRSAQQQQQQQQQQIGARETRLSMLHTQVSITSNTVAHWERYMVHLHAAGTMVT